MRNHLIASVLTIFLLTACSTLDQPNALSYDELIQVYRDSQDAGKLAEELLCKHNPNPRVDQMILIFAMNAIAKSKTFIPNVEELLWSALRQDSRLNTWTMSFVTRAIADYKFGLPNGDELMDFVEAKNREIYVIPKAEYWGYHFLPPPKTKFMKDYLAELKGQKLREIERSRYYTMVFNGISEKRIVSVATTIPRDSVPRLMVAVWDELFAR